MAFHCRFLAVVGLVSAGLFGLAAPARAQNNPYTWNTESGVWASGPLARRAKQQVSLRPGPPPP